MILPAWHPKQHLAAKPSCCHVWRIAFPCLAPCACACTDRALSLCVLLLLLAPCLLHPPLRFRVSPAPFFLSTGEGAVASRAALVPCACPARAPSYTCGPPRYTLVDKTTGSAAESAGQASFCFVPACMLLSCSWSSLAWLFVLDGLLMSLAWHCMSPEYMDTCTWTSCPHPIVADEQAGANVCSCLRALVPKGLRVLVPKCG
jgi:hypothetical protein